MNRFFLGRSSRLTAYFCGLSVGLALLVAGVSELWIIVLGEFSVTLSWVFLAIGIGVGLVISFVFGYLNGGLLASWTGGAVPMAGSLGGSLTSEPLSVIAIQIVSVLGYGILIGALGFVLAVEKHRLDRRTADLPEPVSRPMLVGSLALSVLLGGMFLWISSMIR